MSPLFRTGAVLPEAAVVAILVTLIAWSPLTVICIPVLFKIDVLFLKGDIEECTIS